MKVVQCTAGQQQLPPEWQPTDKVLLTWPHADGDWGNNLARVESTFYALAEALLGITSVTISAATASQASNIRSRLPGAQVFVVPSNDIWVRDHGPITVLKNGGARLLNANFNGWGHKYPAELDNQVTENLHRQQAFGRTPQQTVALTLEGGAIEVDGNGLLMSRLCCLPNRNPELSLQQLSDHIGQLLGVSQIAWLEHGELAGDDTDAHIDTLARFLPNNRIVYQGCDDPNDEHFASLAKLGAELTAMRNNSGQPYNVTKLPWPQACFNENGERLPLGYANFLSCNNHILLPVYGVPQDDAAIACMKTAAPNFTILPINCRALVQQYGSLHCATMQIPAAAHTNNPQTGAQQ